MTALPYDAGAEVAEAQAALRAGLDAAARREAEDEARILREREALAARGEGEAEALARWEARRAESVERVRRRFAAQDAARAMGRIGRALAGELVESAEDAEQERAAEVEARAAPEVTPSAAAVRQAERKAKTKKRAEAPSEQEVLFR